MSNLPNKRNQRDATLTVTTALPAAAANNNTASLDTGLGPHREAMELELSCPTLPALVDDKTVTFEWEHSSDDSTFTDMGDAVAENTGTSTVSGNFSQVITGTETPGAWPGCDSIRDSELRAPVYPSQSGGPHGRRRQYRSFHYSLTSLLMKPKPCATPKTLKSGAKASDQANRRQQGRLATIAAIALDGQADIEAGGKSDESKAMEAVSKAVLD